MPLRGEVGIIIYASGKGNNNNKHFFNLQVANSPSRLRFEANLSREIVNVQSIVKTRRVRLIQGRQSMWEMLD